jgi:outer membrane lipoprotein-sorting protein
MLDIEVTDGRGETSPRTLEIWQRGDEERLVRLGAPPRLKGVGLLVTKGETVYLFLPQYPPARRVVGNKRADAFLGTDFAVEDLSRLQYSNHYDAVVAGTEGELTSLVLKPRKATGDTELRLWVDADAVIRRIDHVDAKGEVNRRLILDDIRLVGSNRIAHKMVVTDLKRNRQTQALLKKVELNTGLSDLDFSVTQLEAP